MAKQDSAALLYLAFTIYYRFTDLPASERTLLCFAEFLLRSYSAAKSVTNTLSVVKQLHLDLRLPTEVFESPALHRWKRALPLTVRWVPHRAPPLPLAILEQLCSRTAAWGHRGRNMAALYSLLFHTLTRLSTVLPVSEARFDPTRNATPADCIWVRGRLWFRVKWTKAQQRPEQGFWVPLLPRPGSVACPVAALSALQTGMGAGSRGPLFLGSRGSALTIPAARDWLRVGLVALGHRPDAFNIHSFRRGACTAAFANGAQLEDLKALGGWSSNSVELYRSAADARVRAASAQVITPSP